MNGIDIASSNVFILKMFHIRKFEYFRIIWQFECMKDYLVSMLCENETIRE